MRRQTLCFLVIGTSLAMLLQNLSKRRTIVVARPPRGHSAEVIDLAAWRALREGDEMAMPVQ
jgi:hypothetical protein